MQGPRTPMTSRSAALSLVLLAALTTAACATPSGVAEQSRRLDGLQTRLDEIERTNGRLTVRVEELEDQLFLLQDRVASHRIALQRRGQLAGRAVAVAPARPQPVPETYYTHKAQDPQPVSSRAPRRPVTRIPLGAERQQPTRRPQPAQEPATPAQEIVINREELGDLGLGPSRDGDAAAPAERGSGSATARKRTPQPTVTSERLPGKSGAAAVSTATTRAPAPSPGARVAPLKRSAHSSSLSVYREAIAQYRAGHYREALAHFESFLSMGPKEDYLDNALYWIGECHYGLGHFEQSVSLFERVLKEHPDGNKVPNAMLKMSLAYEQLKRPDQAKNTLQKLVQRYPMTPAARLAQQKIKELP